jgi:hypothetical protein
VGNTPALHAHLGVALVPHPRSQSELVSAGHQPGRQTHPGADSSSGAFLDMVLLVVIVIVVSILLLLYVIVIVVFIYNIVFSPL